jgi:hypothetical protein
LGFISRIGRSGEARRSVTGPTAGSMSAYVVAPAQIATTAARMINRNSVLCPAQSNAVITSAAPTTADPNQRTLAGPREIPPRSTPQPSKNSPITATASGRRLSNRNSGSATISADAILSVQLLNTTKEAIAYKLQIADRYAEIAIPANSVETVRVQK